jgi:hypothetical protein
MKEISVYHDTESGDYGIRPTELKYHEWCEAHGRPTQYWHGDSDNWSNSRFEWAAARIAAHGGVAGAWIEPGSPTYGRAWRFGFTMPGESGHYSPHPHGDYLGWTRREATLVMEAIISALRLD